MLSIYLYKALIDFYGLIAVSDCIIKSFNNVENCSSYKFLL